MNDDPYRSGKRPKSELERLAEEGELRHAARHGRALSDATNEADHNLRTALGAHFGTPILRSFKYAHYASILVLVGSIALVSTGHEAFGLILGVAMFLAFILIFLRVFWPPTATASMVDAEAAWQSALPFPATGYFEALREKSSIYCQLEIEVTLVETPRDPQVLRGVVHRIDPDADCSASGHVFRWRSKRIDGSTGIRVNGRYVYRSHNVVKYVHEVVDGVLEPIHRETPGARVAINRQ